MLKNVTEGPADPLDFQVFRAIMAEAPKIMDRVFGPLPEAGDDEEDPEQASASGGAAPTEP